MQPDPRFIDFLNQAVGSRNASDLLLTIYRQQPETSVRINPDKPAELDILSGASGVPWNPLGHYLSSRPRFTFDPAMHQGLYYVQDASSMFVGHVASHIAGITGGCAMRVLDACAAPGGKTTAIADALPAGSTIVANEYDRQRASVLAENIAKWGNPAVIVTQGGTSRFDRLHGTFDLVIVDAPCSGEGMMRKDRQAIEQWSPALVSQCANRQKEILENLVGCIAPGGFLVYSTCTFNRQENEEIVRWLTDSYNLQPVDIPVDPSWGIMATSASGVTCYRFMPSLVRGEGLFMATMRMPGEYKPYKPAAPRVKSIPEADSWTPSLLTLKKGDRIFGLPPTAFHLYKEIESKSGNILVPGVEIATIKGRDLIPSAPLALSTAIAPDAFPRIEISRDEAISFLHRDTITLPSGTAPRGHILLTYGGYPLGFVKNLGNRANNLYPANWRIRSNIKD